VIHRWRLYLAAIGGRYIHILYQSGIGSRVLRAHLCGLRHIFTSGLARNGCQWPIFASNARITLSIVASRLVQNATGRTDDWNTTSGSTGSEYSTSQVTGSTFLPYRGFRIVDLRVQTAVFVVSVKPEVFVSRPEVVL